MEFVEKQIAKKDIQKTVDIGLEMLKDVIEKKSATIFIMIQRGLLLAI